MIGKTVLNYEITEQLGAGGVVVVYKAEDARCEHPGYKEIISRLG